MGEPLRSLGQRLYEALAEPFSFKGRWNRERKPLTCQQYELAARAFAAELGLSPAEALLRAAETDAEIAAGNLDSPQPTEAPHG
jgi:hypothetical protein